MGLQSQATDFSVSSRRRAPRPCSLPALQSSLPGSLLSCPVFWELFWETMGKYRAMDPLHFLVLRNPLPWRELKPGGEVGEGWEEEERSKLFNQLLGLEEITLDLGRDWQIFITQAPHECFLLLPTQATFLKVDLLICFVHLQGVYLANWPHPSKGSTITRKIYEADWTNKATSDSHLSRRRTSEFLHSSWTLWPVMSVFGVIYT